MKIYINNLSLNHAKGGANQFLNCLKKYLDIKKLITNSITTADLVLFNSHHNFQQILELKKKFPNKKFVHRVDGPMRMYNNMLDNRDDIVYRLNELAADATIFQSQFSKEKNIILGMSQPSLCTIIPNAADPDIFFKSSSEKRGEKLNIIATSWSDNINKGFEYYKFLDENLDFSKYKFSFAGRSPIKFLNIINLGILNSRELALELRKNNVYLTASKNDPCSNSLIEAITSGLTSLALNSGGHPEIIKNTDLLFKDKQEMLNKINFLYDNQQDYMDNIKIKNIFQIVEEYITFFKEVLES